MFLLIESGNTENNNQDEVKTFVIVSRNTLFFSGFMGEL
jgi:hypothetical protein